MTPPSKNAVFLAKGSYRKRRMRDFARAVPLFGVVLLLIPLLWNDLSEPASTSGAVVYVFCVWVFLIILAAGISRAVTTDQDKAL
jgi:lipopolysaccharide export LptBFGC system permease protein LptF